jgi:hypothetical protein
VMLTKPVIYKAIFGGYDNLPVEPPADLCADFRFVLITDRKVEVAGWEVLTINTDNPTVSNRACKFSPWQYFDSEYSFYLDGHVTFGSNFKVLARDLLSSQSCFSVFKHRYGGQLSSEFLRCVTHGKLEADSFLRFVMLEVDFSKESVECGFIFRRHGSPEIVAQGLEWMRLFQSVVKRDQLLVHESFKGKGISMSIIDSTFNSEDDYLRVGVHKNAKILNLALRLRKAIRIVYSGLYF